MATEIALVVGVGGCWGAALSWLFVRPRKRELLQAFRSPEPARTAAE